MLKPYLIVLLIPLLLTGCGRTPPWHAQDIRGVMPDLAFHLNDDFGKPVTEKGYAGKITLLYFGFTHCGDVCPATLTTLSAALRHLGTDADRVRVLFVSVDPKRDTPAVLHDYTAHFSPQVVGLSGDDEQLQTLSKRYRVSYSYGKPDADGDYEVYHSSAIFAFDSSGRTWLLMDQKEGAANIAADLRRLIAESGPAPQNGR